MTPTVKEQKEYTRQLAILEQYAQRNYEDNTFKVVMYRIREDDGSGALSDSAFAEEINNLNTYYHLHDICFSLVRIENIDRSDYLLPNWGDDNTSDSMKTVIATNYPIYNDAITIYVLPPSLFYRGSAYGIPASALIMTSQAGKWNTSHIAHEVGHCLGLIHTHETVGNSSIEVVTRTLAASCINGQGAWQDCNVGGDGLCDTPADFGLSSATVTEIDSANCTVSVDSLDCLGDLYTPNPHYIMSYAPTSCRTIFSGQQVGKMHLTIDLSGIFNSTQAPSDFNFGDAIYTTSYAHFLAKNTITIAPGSTYSVQGDAQIIHDAEGYIDLKPGFTAAPSSVEGYFRARAKNLCENDPDLPYAMTN
jgi:hypothetical protein